ncbi:sulfatase [Halorubrum ezzemoulense]|uniref:Sulfatase n=1 Tax=Halorubrum ezzemoulense TaxID=337243 RepID=A0ABT4Z0U8_HALEZ|nr:sulfatase [Halorubrum ezzemoulense]MDB2244329.1 sulfatase [Halorubrum ezzemoulense]MDB2278914.1 sulfatase [Halorubrum ezzemoulense]MDB2287663.1 sulfatase [Halorubrum ezzemoulense]MDB2291788.1 sulfatase [Halorubrum ezzemoulense]MDB2295549.1 sulfatase [Halorubrum ezzemoulense]
MNVVIVVVDALRQSDVGCYGREEGTTPNIDRLAQDSMVFENAYSLSNYTDICMSSILSGLAPREHGVTHHGTAHTEANLERIQERSPTFLPEILSESGYSTLGVDWMGRWHAWGYDDYGVDLRQHDSGIVPSKFLERVKWTLSDLPEPIVRKLLSGYYRLFGYDDVRVNCEDLTDIAIKRIDEASSPSFTLLHYWDVHPPYLPPEEYEQKFDADWSDEPLSNYFGGDRKGPMAAEFPPYAAGERETVGGSKRAYDGAISWVDEQIGRLIDCFESEEMMDETMIVVTADHGHNFGEHGIFSDNCGMFDTSIKVPLVVYDPREEGQRISGLVQHTDIVPTVLDYAGVSSPDLYRGNVLPDTREFAFAEAAEQHMRMIRTDDWKLVVPEDVAYLKDQYWYDGDGTPELYDIHNDSTEENDVSEEHPDIVRRLRRRMDKEVRKQQEFEGGERSVEIEEEELDDIRSQLGALGYADDDNV